MMVGEWHIGAEEGKRHGYPGHEIAEMAFLMNEQTENIGARRLHTILEKLLEDISFNAGDEDMPPVELKIDGDYVRAHLSGENKPADLRRYIL